MVNGAHLRYILIVVFSVIALMGCAEKRETTTTPPPDDSHVAIVEPIDNTDTQGSGSEIGLGSLGTIGHGSGKGTGGLAAGGGPKKDPTPEYIKRRQMRDLIKNLKAYPIAYETPETAEQGLPFDVTLAIDASGDDSAVEGLPQTQRVTENVARLSEIVSAKLSGAAFEIKASNSPRQIIRPDKETVWRWTVVPILSGEHPLYLEIFTHVDGDAMMLESFSDEIAVAVTPNVSPAENNKPRLIDDMRIYISIFGGLISMILGLIALKGHWNNKGRKDKNVEEKSEA